MSRKDPAWNLLAKFKWRDISLYSAALGSSTVMVERQQLLENHL